MPQEDNDPLRDFTKLLSRYHYLVIYIAVITTAALLVLLFGDA